MHHHRERSHSRSRLRSRSPRRARSRDRGRRDEERDRPNHRPPRSRSRTRSRSRERGRHRQNSRSRSRSRQRHRRGSREHSRSRSRSRSRDRKVSRKRRRSVSPSSSSSSESEGDRKRRKKEKAKRKESKEMRRERKREKKAKKDKKKGSSSSHWGKYGLITEIDLFTKGAEFHAWLVEERKINPETLAKDQEKREFAQFVEDYNTATLPHEKFYDMAKYDLRMNALRQGEFLPPADDTYDPEADMRALTGTHKKKATERETYMSREQLEELRRVQNERAQVGKMKLLGMDVKQSMGVRMDGTSFDEI